MTAVTQLSLTERQRALWDLLTNAKPKAPAYSDCTVCAGYLSRRRHVIKKHALKAGVFSRFMKGVHQRHLDGLSLDVCRGCGTTPEQAPRPFATEDECTACRKAEDLAAIRAIVIYSLGGVA